MIFGYLSVSAQNKAKQWDQPELLETKKPARTFSEADTLRMTIFKNGADKSRKNTYVTEKYEGYLVVGHEGDKNSLEIDCDSVILAKDSYVNSSMMFVRDHDTAWRLIRLESRPGGKISCRQIWKGYTLRSEMVDARIYIDKDAIVVQEKGGEIYALSAEYLPKDLLTPSTY